MDKKKDMKKINLPESIIVILLTIIIGFILGLSAWKVVFHEKYNMGEKIPEELNKFIENYNYIVKNYYGDLDKEKVVNSAIEGMLGAIEDPYTSYIDSSSSNSFTTTLEGTFEGIGVEVVNDANNNIVVYRVIENSPSEKSGIKSMDIIKSINGESFENKLTSELVNMIKNSKESKFKIVVLRDNKEIELTVNREKITLTSVTSSLEERNNKKIGYISISIFANNTYEQFKENLYQLELQNIDSLIIDVRNNSGGHLTSVERIISLFLEKNHVIYQTEDSEGIEKFYSTGDKTKQYKIVILTNENSASASEILTSALKDEYGAISIGKKTYGKGSVQELRMLSADEQYKFTTKKWLTPKGTCIDTIGINADIEVEMQKKYYEEPTKSNDNQLEKALEYLEK